MAEEEEKKHKKNFMNIFGIYVLHFTFLGVAKRRHSLHINVKQ